MEITTEFLSASRLIRLCLVVRKFKERRVGCDWSGPSRLGLCLAALGLGMKVIGYDPVLSLEAALQLPGDRMKRVTELDELFAEADYITVHVPYIKGVTHHLINSEALAKCKPNVHLLNFARGEIIRWRGREIWL